MKYLYAALFILIATAFAAEMSSSSYKIESAMPSAGGISSGPYFIARTTVENLVGRTESLSYIAILGFDFPIGLGVTLNETVTFVLEFNISGLANDAADIDTQQLGSGQPFLLATTNMSNIYVCMEDTALSGTPTYGIVFSGSAVSYINLSRNTTEATSYNLRLSQAQSKNRFVIPITRDGCSNVRGKFQLIKIHGIMPQAYVPFFQGQAPIDIILSYPDLDIIGDFAKSGPFRLILQKNETDTTAQIIATD